MHDLFSWDNLLKFENSFTTICTLYARVLIKLKADIVKEKRWPNNNKATVLAIYYKLIEPETDNDTHKHTSMLVNRAAPRFLLLPLSRMVLGSGSKPNLIVCRLRTSAPQLSKK